MRQVYHSRGFTLVEVSIVLAIIALIVGGILVGRQMIKLAAYRSDISKIESLQTAITIFKQKYDYLPGDAPNFSDFFPGAPNGDGDGIVRTENGAFQLMDEAGFVVDHLAYANLIPMATYDPRDANNAVLGKALIPLSEGDGLCVRGEADLRINFLKIGCGQAYNPPLPVVYTNGGMMSPDEGWYIDNKLDDGRPMTGTVLVMAYAEWPGPPIPGGNASTYPFFGFEQPNCFTAATNSYNTPDDTAYSNYTGCSIFIVESF